MSVVETLRKLRTDLLAQKARVDSDLRDVELALAAIGGDDDDAAESLKNSMPIDQAIVMAISAGNQKPRAILSYLANELDINTTINSIRTRVSRLYTEGMITRDEAGWASTIEE